MQANNSERENAARQRRNVDAGARTIVKRLPVSSPGQKGVRAEIKLAYLHLLEKAGGVGGSIVTRASEIAHDLGTSPTSGRRSLKRMDELGLATLSDRDFKHGPVTVTVNDPRVTSVARLVRGQNEDQGELPYPSGDADAAGDQGGEEASVLPMTPPTDHVDEASAAGEILPPDHAGATVHQHDPSTSGDDTSKNIGVSGATDHVDEPPTSLSLEALKLQATTCAPHSRGKALSLAADHLHEPSTSKKRDIIDIARERMNFRQPPQPEHAASKVSLAAAETPLAGTVEKVMSRLPAAADETTWVQQKAAIIKAEVGDPILFDGVCLRVARAIFHGLLPESDLDDVLRIVRRDRAVKKPGFKAWICFVGSMKFKFGKRGIPWEKSAGEPASTAGERRQEDVDADTTPAEPPY